MHLLLFIVNSLSNQLFSFFKNDISALFQLTAVWKPLWGDTLHCDPPATPIPGPALLLFFRLEFSTLLPWNWCVLSELVI